MRGTNVRMAWWVRYLSPTRFAWWMPVIELASFLLSFLIIGRILFDHTVQVHDPLKFVATTALFGVFLNYVVALRYFIIRRSDESLLFQIATFALAPVAGLWRLVFLRPLMLYAMLTFWKVGKWGTRSTVEVGADGPVEHLLAPQTADTDQTMSLVPHQPGRHSQTILDAANWNGPTLLQPIAARHADDVPYAGNGRNSTRPRPRPRHSVGAN
jgi:hyaluronan synthase